MRLFRRKALPHQRLEVKAASLLYGLGAARWLERRFDILATEGYEQNPVVYACVTKLARAVASVDIQLYRRKGGKLQKLESHKLLDLLEKPNPLMGGRRFLETLATYYLVGGNAYVQGAGMDPQARTTPPKELWLLPTQCVTVRDGPRNQIPGQYEYREKSGRVDTYPVDQITGRSQVLQLKTTNLLNPLLGLPPLVAAAFGVDVFNAGQEWNKALLQNGAKPPGALTVKDGDGKPATLTDDQYDRMKRMIDSEYSGAKNAGRPLLLEGGVEWQQLGMSPVDMDHKENMLTNARFIAGVYHVPEQLLNIPGSSTFANFEQATVAFWTTAALPLLGTLLEDLTNWLAPLYGDDLFLWYDEAMIEALEPLRKAKGERVNAAGYMTINEKRREMGLDDIDGGDVVLVPSSNIPLDLAGSAMLPEVGSEDDQDEEEAE